MSKNHLIELASLSTGSLLIWDTGTYEVLRSERQNIAAKNKTSSASDEDINQAETWKPENEKLIDAFKGVSPPIVRV